MFASHLNACRSGVVVKVCPWCSWVMRFYFRVCGLCEERSSFGWAVILQFLTLLRI